MKKKYGILLSSFIASTSMGMQYDDLTEFSDWIRYGILKVDEFSDIYAVEQQIKKDVATLCEINQFTQEAVLAKIENALKPKPHLLPTLQRLYKWNDKVTSITVNLGAPVHKYDVSPEGSQGAFLFRTDAPHFQTIAVYAEGARGDWELIRSVEVANIKNIYLVNGGKKLAKIDVQDRVSFENLDFMSDGLSNEDLMEEVRERHKKNYCQSSRGIREVRVIHRDTIAAFADLDASDRTIDIEQSGFKVDYTPTLEEIAQYIVNKAQQAKSQN